MTADAARATGLASGWFSDADDSVWVLPSNASIGRGANSRPTAGGFSLARIDTTGGLAGVVRVAPQRVQADAIWQSDQFYGVTFNSDGTAFVTVRQNYIGRGRFQILKYSRDGVLDTKFGTGGSLIIPAKYEATLNQNVLTQATPDGGLVFAIGQTNAVYTARGKKADTVNGDGTIDVEPYLLGGGSTSSLYTRLGVDKQGRILVLDSVNADRPRVGRFNRDGSFDESYGPVTLPAGDWYAQFTVLADDGSIVLLGNDVRITADGKLDAGWADTGRTVAGDTATVQGFLGTRNGYLDTSGRFYAYGNATSGTPQTTRYASLADGVTLGSDGTLVVTGTLAADAATVLVSGNTVTAKFNGITKTFAASAVKRLSVDLYGGDDNFRTNLVVPQTIDGGAGDDTIAAGDGRADIDLGNGNNVVVAGNGGGTVRRAYYSRFGTGVDEIDRVTAGRGVWNLDFGYDYLAGSNGTFTLTGGQYTLRTGDGDQKVTVNSDLASSITTFAGDDTIVGGAGNDQIYAGDGKNVVNAGDGNDRVYSAYGDDSLVGGAGDDTLVGGGRNDTLKGQAGNDRIYAGTPGSGDDDATRNVIDGGDGGDILFAGTADDRYMRIETFIGVT